jgi:hypothetical protein
MYQLKIYTLDMEGFDVSDILGVEDVLLDPVAGSPLA